VRDKPIKIVVAEDSATFRLMLRRMLSKLSGAQIVATAEDGLRALEAARTHKPDFLITDLEMPGANGVEVVQGLKEKHPGVVPIVMSAQEEGPRVWQALEAGAIDFVPKPKNQAGTEAFIGHLRRLIDGVERAAGKPKLADIAPANKQTSSTQIGAAPTGPFSAVLIGSSTGGPTALETVVAGLPAGLGCPVMLVQHIPAGYTGSLARNLSRYCPIPVNELKSGDVLQAGQVGLAPGGINTKVVRTELGGRKRIVVRTEVPADTDIALPSIDTSLFSLLRSVNGPVLTVILTGMGRDGCDGVEESVRAGGLSLAQCSTGCTVYGMPRAVIEAGLAHHTGTLSDIRDRLSKILTAQVRAA